MDMHGTVTVQTMQFHVQNLRTKSGLNDVKIDRL